MRHPRLEFGERRARDNVEFPRLNIAARRSSRGLGENLADQLARDGAIEKRAHAAAREDRFSNGHSSSLPGLPRALLLLRLQEIRIGVHPFFRGQTHAGVYSEDVRL